MKTRNKVFSALGVVIVVGISALMITLAHESPCPQAPTLAAGTESMRAITQSLLWLARKGLVVERIAKPKPAAGEILIKVRAASVNPYEWHTVTGKPYVMRLGSGIGGRKVFAWATTWRARSKPSARTSPVSNPAMRCLAERMERWLNMPSPVPKTATSSSSRPSCRSRTPPRC